MTILLLEKECGHFMITEMENKESTKHLRSKKEKKIDLDHLTPEEEMKYEIAKELGLLDRVMRDGWKSLSAKETGRVGGLMTKQRREMKKEMKKE